jgi:putative transposase
MVCVRKGGPNLGREFREGARDADETRWIDGAGPGEPEVRGPARVSAGQLRQLFADDTWLDELVDSAGEGGVVLTGPGGFLPELIKAVLEKGLEVERTDHLGYEAGDPAGRGSPNSRKRVDAEDGADRGRPGRDRDTAGPARHVRAAAGAQGAAPPRGPGRADHQPLRGRNDGPGHRGPLRPRDRAAGVRRVRAGKALSGHDTISKITDAVLDEEVKAWQNRTLGIWVQNSEGAKFWAGVCAATGVALTDPRPKAVARPTSSA